MNDLLTVPQAAALMGCKPRQMQYHCALGRLGTNLAPPGRKPHYIISRAELAEFQRTWKPRQRKSTPTS